jgi:hypothetical protein
MKQLIGFIILLSALFGCQKPEPEVYIEVVTIYRDTCDSEFIAKIGTIETGGTDSITAEQGRGVGRYGIYNVCVRGSGLMDLLGYEHIDMMSKEKSDHVFWAMMGIFCYQYAQKHGHYPNYEDLARMWAGGPTGYKKNSTLKYLEKFKTI